MKGRKKQSKPLPEAFPFDGSNSGTKPLYLGTCGILIGRGLRLPHEGEFLDSLMDLHG